MTITLDLLALKQNWYRTASVLFVCKGGGRLEGGDETERDVGLTLYVSLVDYSTTCLINRTRCQVGGIGAFNSIVLMHLNKGSNQFISRWPLGLGDRNALFEYLRGGGRTKDSCLTCTRRNKLYLYFGLIRPSITSTLLEAQMEAWQFS